MSDRLTPEPRVNSKAVFRRVKNLPSTHLFSALLILLAVVNGLFELPYGSLLLILAALMLANAKVGVILLILSTLGLYLTSDDFYRWKNGVDSDCYEKNWSQRAECRSQAQEIWLEGAKDATGADQNFKVLYPPRLRYPTEAYIFGASYSATFEVTLLADGSVEIVSINSSGSDMRTLFDEAVREYISRSFWVETASPEVNLPATADSTISLNVKPDSEVDILVAVAFYLLMFSAAGAFLARGRSLLHFYAEVAAPTGVYIASFYACFAISSYTTTNYEVLGKGLAIGTLFLGLGAFSSELRRVPIKMHSAPNPIGYVLLALLPIVELATSYDPLLEFWTYGAHSYSAEFGAVFSSLFNGYVIAILCFAGVLNAFALESVSTRKKLDLLILSCTATVAVSIVAWFMRMGAIADDYLEIFPVLRIAAVGVACTSLLFIVLVISSRTPVPKPALKRRVLLLLEVFTFYLFFAYAPTSISELGQQFEQMGAEQAEKRDLEERLQALESVLDIKPLRSEELQE